MSWPALAWATRQKTGSATRKAVLVALADCHNGHTGQCNPRETHIASEWELSERTVRRALDDLTEQGLISRERKRRQDGTLGEYRYTLHMDTVSEPPATMAGSPPDTMAGQEPGSTPEPGSTTTSNEVVVHSGQPRSWRVDRRPVTSDEEVRATEILAYWNQRTGQSLRSRDWLAKIVMRIREHPEGTLAEHHRVIDAALASPWWRGPASPSVVYGNGAQFERSIEAARAPSGYDRVLAIANDQARIIEERSKQ